MSKEANNYVGLITLGFCRHEKLLIPEALRLVHSRPTKNEADGLLTYKLTGEVVKRGIMASD